MNLFNTTVATLALTFTVFASDAKTETKLETKTPQSLISFIDTKEATGDVKAVYDEVTKAWGFVPIVLK